jgi:septum site-determining protein MinC
MRLFSDSVAVGQACTQAPHETHSELKKSSSMPAETRLSKPRPEIVSATGFAALTHPAISDLLIAAARDVLALTALLRAYRLNPLAVRGGSDEQMAQAMAAGLTPAPEAVVQRAAPAAAATAPEPVAPPQPAPGALVIDKPLRSGQQVYARGRDLVVMAMVNPGAEVIADGHIHVYAPLRGKAMAGARGNGDARIFALAMDPELISIAGIYRTSETALPADVRGKAAQVRLLPGPEGDKLVVDPLNS